ncbi:hypothetical protein ACFUGD_02745 [Streptomyces sp. NPDC057217]|uniref:hypothetical protein n=1 Tax=Streptomyces sp. NPDC057217 TaxID=3346054 RepID=UPI00362DAF5D
MTDQTAPCRSTRHCADHGFCHRCTPSLDGATQHLVKAISSAGIEYPASGSVYAALAATLRDAVRPAAVQDDPASWPLVPVTIGPAGAGAARQATGQADTTPEAVPTPEEGIEDARKVMQHVLQLFLNRVPRDELDAETMADSLADALSDGLTELYRTAARAEMADTDQPDPTTADDPTPLRWGYGDVLHGDDDSIIVCLSGPTREPYWLELDPERAAALRKDLTPEDAPVVGQPAAAPDTEVLRVRDRWYVEYLFGQGANAWWGVAQGPHTTREQALSERETRRDAPADRRLVRETTTWTVEDEARRAAGEAR